jgi:hypothetical protein
MQLSNNCARVTPTTILLSHTTGSNLANTSGNRPTSSDSPVNARRTTRAHRHLPHQASAHISAWMLACAYACRSWRCRADQRICEVLTVRVRPDKALWPGALHGPGPHPILFTDTGGKTYPNEDDSPAGLNPASWSPTDGHRSPDPRCSTSSSGNSPTRHPVAATRMRPCRLSGTSITSASRSGISTR